MSLLPLLSRQVRPRPCGCDFPRTSKGVQKGPLLLYTDTTASDLFNLNEDYDESEVDLDSLGCFFIHLIDTDCYQDDAETSQAGDDEVNIISSDSEPLPRQKIR